MFDGLFCTRKRPYGDREVCIGQVTLAGKSCCRLRNSGPVEDTTRGPADATHFGVTCSCTTPDFDSCLLVKMLLEHSSRNCDGKARV